MSLDYIRRAYKVPAKRGGRVRIDGHLGTIIGSSGPHLMVRFDEAWIKPAVSARRVRVSACHPTWMVEYLPGAKVQILPMPSKE